MSMLSSAVYLRLIEGNPICWRCANKLSGSYQSIQTTRISALANSYSEATFRTFQSAFAKEKGSECVGLLQNQDGSITGDGLKYDSSKDMSWKLQKGPGTGIGHRYIPVLSNCQTNDLKSNSVYRQQYLGVARHGFHTSSADCDKDSDKKIEVLTELSSTLQKLTHDKASLKAEVSELRTKHTVQSDVLVKSADNIQKHVNKLDSAKATQDKVEPVCAANAEEVTDAVSNETTTVTGELAQFDGAKQIKEFLKEHDMVTTQGHTCYITTCPKLGKIVMKRQQKCEGERLFINCTSGHFLCEHCRKSGGWPHLKDNIAALRGVRKKKEYKCFDNVSSVKEEPQTTPPEVLSLLQTAQDITVLKRDEFENLINLFDWQTAQEVTVLKREEFENLINLFDWQGITQATLGKYGAKYSRSGDTYSILLPVKSIRGVVVGVRKFVATQKHSDDDETHTTVRVTSHPRHLTETFGWQSVSSKSTSIVITGSEVESLAIIQKTDIPSIALKNLTYFPQELLPYLERFTKIIMWFGTDVKAWQSSKQFAKKLNDLRCHVFRPNSDMLSPLEVIQSEASLKDMLLKARPIGHDSIVSFNKLRHEVYIELAQIEQVAGVKWKRYTPLNKILKGHRPGELTVLTGPTGSGKTTFVSDYSLDLCTQGVNTLWGSFEISNVRLAKVMLTQFAGKSMTKNLKYYDEIADQFSEIPMFFMTYFGQEQVDKVIEAMSHAVYVHDIKHVIVDNLQFMMGMNYAEGSRFHIQDRTIAMFRRFATKMNCHVTLIIHPRKQWVSRLDKEKDGEELMMASIFGSAKAVQEADNVLILQDMRLTAASGRKYMQVMKNRFDGELGVMMLKFDKDSLRFVASQKKSASQKKDEQEEKDKNDAESVDTKKKDKVNSTLQVDQDVKFKKLDQLGHSYDHILDIDKYYS